MVQSDQRTIGMEATDNDVGNGSDSHGHIRTQVREGQRKAKHNTRIGSAYMRRANPLERASHLDSILHLHRA